MASVADDRLCHGGVSENAEPQADDVIGFGRETGEGRILDVVDRDVEVAHRSVAGAIRRSAADGGQAGAEERPARGRARDGDAA